MAETTAKSNEAAQNQVQATQDPQNAQSNDEKDLASLMAELASVKAELTKSKNANDKLSSEAANYKRQLRSKQTAEEQEAEAKAEAERAKEEKYQAVVKELDHIKAVSAYKNRTDGAAEELVDAVADGDHAAINAIIEREINKAVATAQLEWRKSVPPVNTGSGEYAGMTKEQIMAIQDRTERRKAIARNMNLFQH